MKESIRLLRDNSEIDKSSIKVCPHIILNNAFIEGQETNNGEYQETLFIYCKICKKEYHYQIEIQ